MRAFLELAISSIIITKSGGVSLAFDLAHTRPHLAKVVRDASGKIVLGEESANSTSHRIKLLTKTLRSPLREFEKRCHQNLAGALKSGAGEYVPRIERGDAQRLPLPDGAVDLIVTSPPYASNAIDYMRAHKFSLVWLGYSIGDLSDHRKTYIGGEAVNDVHFEELPCRVRNVVTFVGEGDGKKGRVLCRYYSEMTRVLRDMFRVLRCGKCAIVVVGNSVMRGKDSETGRCLADIGKTIGFEVPKIGVRKLDRNRRMMPAAASPDLNSQIQQRMHEEDVIGFYKPVA